VYRVEVLALAKVEGIIVKKQKSKKKREKEKKKNQVVPRTIPCRLRQSEPPK
jgi:hypothetical protein